MVKANPTSYEDIRQQRLAENMKRMEELNLTKLVQAIRNASPKSSPMKHVKSRTPKTRMTLIQVRRSPRVANISAPIYKEVSMDLVERPKSNLSKRKDLENRVYASDEARMNAIERAEKLQSKLESGCPSFIRSMLPSHVTGGFWLGLPSDFCKRNLPRRDETLTLIDESGGEWPVVWLARKTGLSGGWMGFARAHKLVDGDALIFEMVKPTKIKIHIIKVEASSSPEDLDM